MATPAWFNEVQYLNGKLAQLQNKVGVDAEKDPNGNPYTNISQVSAAIEAAGLTAFEHYDMYGSKENINPSSAFNAEEYCLLKLRQLQATGTDAEKAAWAGSTWQEVQFAIHKAGLSVAGHYSAFGAGEGVPMSNSFDTNAYLTAKLAALVADPATSTVWTGKAVADVSKAIHEAGMDPYTHYMTYGGKANEVASGQTFEVADPVRPSGGDGKTFNFTTGVDSFNGTAANDTFNAVGGTLTAGDFADGAAGWDTLNLYQSTNLTGITLKNIEEVKSFADQGNLDLTKAADVQKFWAVDAGVNSVKANVNQQVGFEGDVQAFSGGSVADTTVTFVSADADGEVAKVALKNADFGASADGDLIIKGDIETVSFDLAGKNKFDTAAVLNVEGTPNLAFTGAGSLETEVSGDAATLASIDASKATGDLSLDVVATNLAKAFAYTGSAGADDLLVSGSSKTNKLTIDLGAGDNELSLTGSGAGVNAGSHKDSTFKAGDGKNDSLTLDTFGTISKAEGTKFTGFEHLTLAGATTKYVAGDIAGVVDYNLFAATQNTTEITNLTNGSDVTFSGTLNTTNTATLNAASTEATKDGVALDLTFDNGSATAASGSQTTLTTNFKVLNVESAGNVSSDDNNLSVSGGNTTVQKVVITGDQDFTFTTGATTALATINGSEATGDLTINASAATTVAKLSIYGGAGNDTISGSAIANFIEAGKGADTVAHGAGADVIKINAGDSLKGGMDQITDAFVAGTDKLDLSSMGITARASAGEAAANTVSITQSATAGVVSDFVVKAPGSIFATNSVVKVGYASGSGSTIENTASADSTLLLIDTNNDGKWDAGDDDVLIMIGTASNSAIVTTDIIFS